MTKGLQWLTGLMACVVSAMVPVFGWNNLGHMTVAYVAYQNLTSPTKQRVNALLKLNPDYATWLKKIPAGTAKKSKPMMVFMIAATWPDQIKSKSGYTDDGSHHGNRPDGASSSQNTGYADHLHHKYWHFVDKPFSEVGTALPAVPTPNAEERIALFRGVLASNENDKLKSYDLVWLLHLAGDVHQPLHCATRVSSAQPDGDDGGNAVKTCNPSCNGELHAFWDGILGSGANPKTAVTVGKGLPTPPASDAGKTKEADWVKESFQEAKNDVYTSPISAGTGPFTITPTYRNAARALAKQRVALAGVRLANMLNDELK